MPINFGQFTDDIADYFESYAARNENDAARFITNLYVINMLQGTDAFFGNVVVGFNKQALESALFNAFNTAFNGNTNVHFSQAVSVGLIGFWTGGTLAFAIPPPISIQVVSNNVTVPGTPQTLRVRNTTSFREFANELVQMFRRHLLSINGITVSLVPAPGAPVPTPFPWSGYR